MARTYLRQDTQIRRSDAYDDTIAPTATAYETNPVHIEDDLNSLRSSVNNLLNRSGASFPSANWFDDITAPSTFENGTERGVNEINQQLHDLERKRILDRVSQVGVDVSIASAGDQYVILPAADLPGNTTMAVGAVTTLGTVTAAATSFGSAELTEVAGPNALAPINMCILWYSAGANAGDPVVDSSGVQIFGLLQSENATDGHTATGTTPDRLQISFVKPNGAADDLIQAASGDMDGVTFDYAPVERFALEDLPEYAFLGSDFVDSGVANATRQASYDNQGVTPVDLTTNAILDLEGAGLIWEIRDDAEASLFRVIEGSAGGTSEIEFSGGVDLWDNDAVVNNIANGIKVATGKTRPIDIGENDGVIESTAGDLRVLSAAELFLDDNNQAGSTWAQTDGIKLSETTAEWDNFETTFGEVSLLNAIVQASSAGSRGTKTYANVTSTTTANNDVGGVGGGTNLDAQLPDMSSGTFLTDYDTYLNGNLLRPGANAAANNDYYPGTSLSDGQLRFEFTVKVNDVIAVIPWA